MRRKFLGICLVALLLVSGAVFLVVQSFDNVYAANPVPYQETYRLSVAATRLNSMLNVLIPADSTVQSCNLTGVIGSYNSVGFLYEGSFSMRCYRFAQIKLTLDSPWPYPTINFNVTVNRNTAPYIPCSSDALADVIMQRIRDYPYSSNLNPSAAYLNLANAEAWRGYPVLAVNKNPSYVLPSQNVNYLIIASSEKQQALNSLIVLKQQQGLNPLFVSIQDINARYIGNSIQSKTIEFLKDAFNTWHMTYVLLVGNTALPPIPYTAYNLSMNGRIINNSETCDYYYSTLEQPPANYSFTWPYKDGLDYPDFILGRFPFDDNSQVANLVAKTVGYETQSNPGDWARKNLVVQGQDAAGDWDIEHYTYNDRPRDYLISPGNLSTQSFVDQVNSGVGALVLLTHGSPYGFLLSGSTFSDMSVRNSLNNTKLPVIFTFGCHTGKFDVGINGSSSVAVAFLEKQNSGAVAMVSGTSYTPYGNIVYLSAYNYWDLGVLAEHRLPNASYEIGKAFYYFCALNTIEYMILLGDPSLRLATANYDLPPNPTPNPTANPTSSIDPTAEPSAAPTSEPTSNPTADPSSSPTATTSTEPISTSTANPSAADPTSSPSASPTPAIPEFTAAYVALLMAGAVAVALRKRGSSRQRA